MVASGACCCVLSRRLQDQRPQAMAIAGRIDLAAPYTLALKRLPCGRRPALAATAEPALPLLPSAGVVPPLPADPVRRLSLFFRERMILRYFPPPDPPPPQIHC